MTKEEKLYNKLLDIIEQYYGEEACFQIMVMSENGLACFGNLDIEDFTEVLKEVLVKLENQETHYFSDTTH